MKKLLSIFWIIIIAGSAFLAFHFLKPASHKEENIEIDDSTGKIIIDQIPAETSEIPDKTYNQYLSDSDSELANGYPEKAITNYKKAVKLNPNSSEPLVKLGEAYLKNNEPAKAKEAFLAASNFNQESEYIKTAVARAHINAREFEEAKNIIWNIENPSPQTKYYKGLISILYKDFEAAKNIFNEIIAIAEAVEDKNLTENTQKYLDAFTTFSYYKEGEQIFLELLLAKTMTDAGEFEASIPLLFDIINKKNNYNDAWLVLGYAYLNTNKVLDAIDALLQAKALNTEKPQTLFFLGLAYFANNEIDEAIHYIEAADSAGYEPKDEINLKLGDLYLLKEEYKKAASKYESVLLVNQKNIGIYIRAVWLNIDKLNNPEKALKLALNSLENHPGKAMSNNLAGWAYTANSNYDKAKEYLQIAKELDPKLEAAYLNFGWLYEKLEKTALAKEYYKKAFILGKGNSIGNLAAIRFNRLTEADIRQYYKVNVSAP